MNKDIYKWLVLLSFLALIFLPKQMPLDLMKWAVILITGLICLFFEFISLKGSTAMETKQTWFLMLLTVAMMVVNFVI